MSIATLSHLLLCIQKYKGVTKHLASRELHDSTTSMKCPMTSIAGCSTDSILKHSSSSGWLLDPEQLLKLKTSSGAMECKPIVSVTSACLAQSKLSVRIHLAGPSVIPNYSFGRGFFSSPTSLAGSVPPQSAETQHPRPSTARQKVCHGMHSSFATINGTV